MSELLDACHLLVWHYKQRGLTPPTDLIDAMHSAKNADASAFIPAFLMLADAHLKALDSLEAQS